MKIWELLDSNLKWTKGASARDISGMVVESSSADAVCWCMLGAVGRCYPPEDRQAIRVRIEAHLPPEYKGSIVGFNDDPRTTYLDVLSLVKTADV